MKKTNSIKWQKKQIKDLLDYERPDKYIVENEQYIESGIPVLTANKSFILGYTDEKNGVYENVPAIIFDDFTTDSKFVDFPFKVKSSAIKILKEKHEDIDLRFVYEQMKSIDFQTGAHKRFYISQYQNLEILVPSLPIQQKIAHILSSVDEAIQITDQIIQKTEKLKSGLMNELLTKGIGHKKFKKTKLGNIPEEWEIVRLGDVVKITNGQVDPKVKPYSNMVLIAPNHIESNTGRVLNRVSALDQKAISGKYLVRSGEVIYSKIRPYLKKVTLADVDCLCSADMYPLSGTERLHNNFLFYLLLSKNFTEYANDNSARTGIPKLNRDELSSYTFAIPTLNEQEDIVARLLSIDQLQLSNQKNKFNNVLLKKGLKQDIFSQKVNICQE